MELVSSQKTRLGSLGSEYEGIVSSRITHEPIAFVNIGVKGKNVGTVSDERGRYTLFIEPIHNSDTLVFSCIGYYSYKICVADFRERGKHDILLNERQFEIREVVIYPKSYRQRKLGVSTRSKRVQAGFGDNLLGYECGVLMNVKKSALLQRININFAGTSYDSLFYRVNIYSTTRRKEFENILTTPIYLKLSRNDISNEVSIDLAAYAIEVHGDFLVTLEHIKDHGPGYLYFCSKLMGKTYYRKTSQGSWETVAIGVGINVDAKVEI